ncbi:uncharacterized protein LOC115087204 [Rhinatrema bivittatum]|uniref:uncharacterized protein LOC115087204 n=1 Tax=Rhinatrema bivittatum TaxID=194408 RepID=UPI00112E2469|nr:uncharacterized protein LOC115087204 [Rhinatrema bivittatum]
MKTQQKRRRRRKNPVYVRITSKVPEVIQEPDAEIPCSKEVAGDLSSTAGEDPLMQGDTARSILRPAATRKSLSTEETETAAELQEKTSDSTSENTEPEMTAPKARPWIWPQGFRKTGMIYIDNEGEYWAVTRPPLCKGLISNPNFMCLIRLRSECVSAYRTGEHQKIYDCFDELALKYPSTYERPINIWTPNEGEGFYVPASMRNSEPEEPKSPEESEQPLNFAEFKHPDETRENAKSKQPKRTVKTAEPGRREEAVKSVESGTSREAVKTATRSTRPQAVLKAAESGRSEAVLAEAERPKKTEKPELATKVDKLDKPGSPEKPIIAEQIEQLDNPAKLKRNRIPRLVQILNIIKKARKTLY